MNIHWKTILKKGHSGFTLMEVLMALAILGFAVLALSRMQMTSIQRNRTAWEFTRAATLAADKIESLTGLAYDHTDLVSGSESRTPYQVEWKVVENGTMKNIKHIAVTVSWKEKKTTHQYVLHSYMRRPS